MCVRLGRCGRERGASRMRSDERDGANLLVGGVLSDATADEFNLATEGFAPPTLAASPSPSKRH